MSGLEKQRLENQIRDMSKEDIKWLCKQIGSYFLINEIGLRLLKFEKHSGEAKESLEKVV